MYKLEITNLKTKVTEIKEFDSWREREDFIDDNYSNNCDYWLATGDGAWVNLCDLY